jgi:hypothetical protein
LNQFDSPKRIILFEGCLEYIFLETDPTTGSFDYAFELWSCEERVVVARCKTFPTAIAALAALFSIHQTLFFPALNAGFGFRRQP